jgi:hypothetical protein
VQLSNLVRINETVAAKELNHFNRQRAAIISANIAPGYTLGEALDFMDRAAAEVLASSARTELDGVSREFRESGASLVFASRSPWYSSTYAVGAIRELRLAVRHHPHVPLAALVRCSRSWLTAARSTCTPRSDL